MLAKSYLSSALWIVPLVALLLENVVIRVVFGLHEWLDWIPWFGTTVTGATEALNTVENLTTAFIVFTFGSLLIVIQVASGQLTPRLIATTLLRNNVIRFTVGLFTFTMMFAVGTGARSYRNTEVCRNNRVGTRHRINRGVFLLDRLYGEGRFDQSASSGGSAKMGSKSSETFIPKCLGQHRLRRHRFR